MKAFHAEAYVSAAAPAVGLELTPLECMRVAEQLKRIHAFAALMMDAPLEPHDELAPRFEP